MIRTLCVFCGSGVGKDPFFAEQATGLARHLLSENMTLVYGGANVGLMRVLADTMLGGGGRVIGIMPRSLVEREVAYEGLTEMHIVDGMQERKALMADLSDAFLALPGGYGTLDELFEVLTWNQLGIVCKPVGLLNPGGFYDPLLQMLDRAVADRFLRPEHRAMLITGADYKLLLKELENYVHVDTPKWIEGLKAGRI